MRFLTTKIFPSFAITLLVAPLFFTAFFLRPFEAFAQQAPGSGSAAAQSPTTTGVTSTVSGVASCGIGSIIRILTASKAATLPGGVFQVGLSVPTIDVNAAAAAASNTVNDNLFNCIARSIARALLQALTASIVNWINSGFNGNPFYVRDYEKFFTGIADRVIGEFIAEGPFAFLCSPFQLQVRLAVARSFAQSSAPLCTLTSIVGNVENFYRNFDGGWGAFLVTVTEPTNNVFGAYITLSGQLGDKVANAQGEKLLDLNLGSGFLSFQEQRCTGDASVSIDSRGSAVAAEAAGQRRGCTYVNVTPGRVIEKTLTDAIGATDIQWLGLQRSFDEIINALIGALTRSLIGGGLSSLSEPAPGYTSGSVGDFGTGSVTDQLIGGSNDLISSAGQGILEEIDLQTSVENNYQSENQRSINSIEIAQSLLVSLAQCWSDKGKTVSLTFDQQQVATTSATNAKLAAAALEERKKPYQAAIVRAQANVVALQTWRDELFSGRITTADELTAFTSAYFSARAQGAWTGADKLISLQSENVQLSADMDALNQTTNQKITECSLYPQTPTTTSGPAIDFSTGGFSF